MYYIHVGSAPHDALVPASVKRVPVSGPPPLTPTRVHFWPSFCCFLPFHDEESAVASLIHKMTEAALSESLAA
jgi:hypothetical protein